MKAGDAVAALKASLRPVATCKRDGSWSNIDGSTLVPGDLVLPLIDVLPPSPSFSVPLPTS